MDIQIVVPAVSDEPLADMLRAITEAIVRQDEEKWVGGFLGGEFGYGANWNSTVFEMRPFYWGDCDCGSAEAEMEWCDNHSHADDCYQSELRREKILAGATLDKWGCADWGGLPYKQQQAREDAIYDKLCRKHGLDRRSGCAVHCTCAYEKEWQSWIAVNGHKDTCSLVLPNFLHRASGLRVDWYKYIGRGMEVANAQTDLTHILRDCLADIAQAGVTRTGGDSEAGSVAKP